MALHYEGGRKYPEKVSPVKGAYNKMKKHKHIKQHKHKAVKVKAKVIGLAYTSPRVADVAIDKTKFRTYIHESGGKVSELSDFLNSRDPHSELKNVVLVTSLHEMHRLAKGTIEIASIVKKRKDGTAAPAKPPKRYDVSDVDVFVVFDDPFSLRASKNVNLLDVDPDSPAMGLRRKQVTAYNVNQALRGKKESVELPSPKSINHRFKHPITFRELTDHVHELVSHKVPELRKTAVEKLVGLCRIYTWKRVKKRLLGMGQVNDGVLELDQFCEYAQTGEALRSAYRVIADNGVSLKKAAKKYGADLLDLKYLVEHVPPKAGLTYHKKKLPAPRPVKGDSPVEPQLEPIVKKVEVVKSPSGLKRHSQM